MNGWYERYSNGFEEGLRDRVLIEGLKRSVCDREFEKKCL